MQMAAARKTPEIFPEGRIYATEDELRICKTFAEQSTVGAYLRRSRWLTEAKARDDIFRGKLAEFHVHRHLADLGFLCKEPDVQIYKKKTWAPDLAIIGADGAQVHVHVKAKSHEAAKKYCLSWVFEKADKHVFGLNPGVVAFVTTYGTSSLVHGVYAVNVLRERELFKPLERDIPSKVAVYYKDLINVEVVEHLSRREAPPRSPEPSRASGVYSRAGQSES